VADLAGSDEVEAPHVAEALSYRSEVREASDAIAG
jgi:predicted ATPase with chaperone activity